MQPYLPRLLSDIGSPCGIHLLLFLALLLLVDVVVGEGLHALVAVSFYLQVTVCYYHVVNFWRVDHWTWDKVIEELDLEEDALVVDKVEGTVDGLNADLLCAFLLV